MVRNPATGAKGPQLAAVARTCTAGGVRLARMQRSPAARVRPAPPIPHWPGRFVSAGAAEVFLRAVPAEPGAEPGLCVHGLGGSSTNWTDLMDTLRRPGPLPGEDAPYDGGRDT